MHGSRATHDTSRADPRSMHTHAGGKSREFHTRLGFGARMFDTGVNHADRAGVGRWRIDGGALGREVVYDQVKYNYRVIAHVARGIVE